MRQGRLPLLTVVLLAIAVACPALAEENVSLTSMVTSVKRALLDVQKIDENAVRELKLKSVDLELSVGTTHSGKGEFSFYILSADGEVSAKTASKITLTLTPPDDEAARDVSSDPIAEALVSAIRAAADAIEEARRGAPPLELEHLHIELNFAFQRKAGGGFTIMFPPFGGKGGAEIDHSEIQTIRADYK